MKTNNYRILMSDDNSNPNLIYSLNIGGYKKTINNLILIPNPELRGE